MYAQVIPCLRLPRKLSSFDYKIPNGLKCQIGDIVFIPFRNSRIFGVINVITKTPRNTRGPIKPITSMYPGVFLSQQQIELVHNFAKTYFVSPATVINSILQTLPRRALFSNNGFYNRSNKRPIDSKSINRDKLLYYNREVDKFNYIIDLVQKHINDKSTVVIITPEISRVRDWESRLSHYSPIIFHRQLSPTVYWANYKKQSERHYGVTIGTRTALFTSLESVNLIIIDEEDNQNHRQAEMNPRYHTEDVVRLISGYTKASMIMTSRTPRTTTMYSVKNKLIECIDIRKELSIPKCQVISLVEEKRLGNYTLISSKLRSYIFQSLKDDKRILLFHNKLGESRSFRCLDCGNPFSCPRCKKSLITESYGKLKKLHCTLCGYTNNLPLSCPICRGVRLKQRGTGIQKIALEIKASFPKAIIQVLSETNSPVVHKDTNIVIGAQRALVPSVFRSVQGIVIVSADTILQLPDFSAPESTYRQLTYISQSAADTGSDLMIQTSFPDHYAIRSATTLDSDIFYQNEFNQRTEYRYPPMTELVRLFIKDKNKRKIINSADVIYNSFVKYLDNNRSIELIQPGPSFIQKSRGQYSWQLVLKFPAHDWPTVRNLISLTTDDWLVDINPLHLLS